MLVICDLIGNYHRRLSEIKKKLSGVCVNKRVGAFLKLNNTLLSKFVSFFSSKPTCLIPAIKQKSKNAIILGTIFKFQLLIFPHDEFQSWCNVGNVKKLKMKKIGYFKRRCSILRAEKHFQVAVVVVEQEPDHDFPVLLANFQFYLLHSMNNESLRMDL